MNVPTLTFLCNKTLNFQLTQSSNTTFSSQSSTIALDILAQMPKIPNTSSLSYEDQLYQILVKQTQEHVRYLTSIGLGERAKSIKFKRFCFEKRKEVIDLISFEKRMSIPEEVLHFNPQDKNTIITTDPDTPCNKVEDLQKILDIRLYPALRNSIEQNHIEVFTGSRQEMIAYYQSKGWKILFEFSIPSSAIYYLASSEQGKFCVVMAGLVSRENIIAQLLTLKLAGIEPKNIEIIGEEDHFKHLVMQDVEKMLYKIPELVIGQKILIVAGCGLEETVCSIVTRKYGEYLAEKKHFRGNIISLTYIPFLNPEKEIYGFISLHLNYGEITEEIIRLILEKCQCKYVFTGGAGGYIPSLEEECRPDIGSRLSIKHSMNEKSEIVTLEENAADFEDRSKLHLQISSIFLETYNWLEKARQIGCSVDVETFYVIRAIANYNAKHSSEKIKADCGCFISDYIGEKPLRDYSKVYERYDEILNNFLQNALSRE